MIAVVGATGNTGKSAVHELIALGEAPVCIVRDPEKARDVLGQNVKITVAELTDRPGLEKAFHGVRSVLVVTGHNPQMDEQQISILEAAKASGVEFFVKISGGKAVVGPDAESVVGRAHYRVEEALRSLRRIEHKPAMRHWRPAGPTAPQLILPTFPEFGAVLLEPRIRFTRR